MEQHLSKSERAVQKAFLTLRQRLPVNQIKVSALCDLAEVNKSTFYRYYQDIYDLAERMETDLINAFVQDITARQPIQEDPQQFFIAFDQALNGPKNLERKNILFREDPRRMLTLLEEALKCHYLGERDYDMDEYIRLSYILGGAFGVCMLMYNRGGVTDTDPIYQSLIQLSKKIWPGQDE